MVTMVLKHPIVKAGTGLLAGFLLFDNQLNAQENQINTNQFTLAASASSREIKIDELPRNDQKPKELLPSFVYRANRKLESRFSGSAGLYDTMNQMNPKGKPLRDIYTDRVSGALESAAEDVGRQLGEEILGRIGGFLFSPEEERKITVSYHNTPEGIAGEYFGKVPNRWKAAFDLKDGEFSAVYDPGANTLLNINLGANGASIALKKKVLNEVNFVAGAEYGGIRIRPEKAEMNWSQNIDIFIGLSKEIRKREYNGLEHVTRSWQIGVNAQNPSSGFAPTDIFMGGTYNIRF